MDTLRRLAGLAISSSESSEPSVPAAGAATIAATVAVTATLLMAGRAWLYPARGAVIPGPLQTAIPKLSQKAVAMLDYPPDAFPGARDVPSPYGSIRVYEFGPEDGEKVLMLHGISTSCMTLSKIAFALVDRGYRVMLFDLFGRGFSDGVGDLPHDVRLYVSQILCVLASSRLPWTGTGALRIVGYSLGGGIAVHFANAFPHLVSSLVLLAPAGVIRAESFGTATRLVFSSGLVPVRLLAALTRRRLQKPIASSRIKKPSRDKSRTKEPGNDDKSEDFVDAAAKEAADPVDGAVQPLERRVMNYVKWMVQYHDGFVPAFMSSIRYAPLIGQHESWRQLAGRAPGTTAVFLAAADEIVDSEDYRQDALPLAGGEENVRWKVLPGGHNFVMTHLGEIMFEIDAFWGI